VAKVGYRRVSSIEQNLDRQLDGLELDKVFSEKVSGKSADRPELQALLGWVREGDEVLVHSLDRLGRNQIDLLGIVQQLTDKSVSVKFVKENLTFNGNDDAISKLMLSMMSAFAEFERALIRERQREGIELAKLKGVYHGRKPSLTSAQADELRKRVDDGEKKSALAREFQISRETLYAYLRAPQTRESFQEAGGGTASENRPPKQRLLKPDWTSIETVPFSEAYPDPPPKRMLPKPDRTSIETVRRTPAALPPEPPTSPTGKA
jgi:DNA invertase Pin-like site-specific DNA recombinase